MQILGTGNRDVEIHTPLNIKSSLTSIDKSAIIGATMPINTVGLFVQNEISLGSNLNVTGNINVSGYINAKPYISLKVITSGGTASTGTTVGTMGTPG